MKIQIKITIALVSLIVISTGMFVLLSPNNTQVTEATSKQTQQVSQKSAEVTENLLQDNKVVDNYHEVFVEKKEDESLLKKVIKEKELDELALDSDKLIQEAEELISKHNLNLPFEKQNSEKSKKLQAKAKVFDEQIKKLEKLIK